MRQSFARRLAGLAVMTLLTGPAWAQDPLASNNGLYPDTYDGRFLLANLHYPGQPQSGGWPVQEDRGPLTRDKAPAYAAQLKDYLAESLRPLIDAPESWDPVKAQWYDMVWSGEGAVGAGGGIDPTSGREALMNTYTGQIIPADTFPKPYRPTGPVQNHAVIYYNHTAAAQLGEVWTNLYAPHLTGFAFPPGSVVVKVEAVTNTPDDWNVLDKATPVWRVFRPTTQDQLFDPAKLVPKVLEVRPLQIAVRVKDPVASPQTGWVFAVFVFDRAVPGTSTWDRFVPLGLQWGNDPGVIPPQDKLLGRAQIQESWLNPAAPAFTHQTFGWGGRLSGPMDVSSRHNVILPDGTRYQKGSHINASSCQSCHGAAEFPRSVNIYPSPNRSFPRDTQPFLLHQPGSTDWMRWFENRPGTIPMTQSNGIVALDYDMALMFAVSAYNEVIGNERLEQETFDVH